ncbi:hypothetical protein DMUE_5799, partial [Dictyocoela muelleri]
MMILLIIKILCAANFYEQAIKHKNSVDNDNTTISNSEINQNPDITNFQHEFEKTPIQNEKFCIEKIQKKSDPNLQNIKSSGLSSNFKNNEDEFYASVINSQTKSNAENHTTNDCTKHNENPTFNKYHQSNANNLCQSMDHNSSNKNPLPNSHFNSESQNNNNINQALEENKFYQSVSK